MLQFDNISLRQGPKLLFEGANLQIHTGQKVGITGANGTGKSSLFSLILGGLHTDEGEFRLPRDWVIAHVAQETPSDDRAAIEYVLDGDAEFRSVEANINSAEAVDNGERLAELHARLDAIGGYQARSRAGRLMHGLGFSAAEESNPVTSFSGGWRMRLNLARALMSRSDLLLLDEPTNHLDLDAVIWLEDWLKSYGGTLLLISHDRDFLDSICNQIVHIEHQHMTLYKGNYSAFEHIRAERLANQQAEHEKQQREVAHIRGYIDRFRAKASKARQAQSRIKALERMQEIAPAHVDSPFHFSFLAPEKTPNPLLKLEQAFAGYADKTILKGINLTLSPGDRIGLLGPNGAGKSTLIKLLAGKLQVSQGKRETAADLKLGYFAQHQLDQLHPEHSPLEHMLQLDPKASEQSLRNHLGGFGFSGDKALDLVGPFSGGEKSRLALALLIYQRPNLLLLDEPTNHLDLEMRQALALALQDYTGAMVIVSHDRHLLRVSTDQLMLVNNQHLSEFSGSLDDYPAWLMARDKVTKTQPVAATGTNQSAADRQQQKREQAERRKALQPLRKKAQQAEKDLDELHKQQTQLETKLADLELYSAENSDRLKALLLEKASIDRQCETQEETWLEVCEALEAAEQS